LFEYELPPELGCAEMYLAQDHFVRVNCLEDSRQGDLFWFGIKHAAMPPESVHLEYSSDGELLNWRDFPVKHVAVHTGINQSDEPMLLHATPIDGGKNTIWPFSRFAEYHRYRKLYGITRLIAACQQS
jgi:hypothetical protein